jgi:hypothetical protein
MGPKKGRGVPSLARKNESLSKKIIFVELVALHPTHLTASFCDVPSPRK